MTQPMPVKINGVLIGYAFIDDSGQLHVILEENDEAAKIILPDSVINDIRRGQ